MKTQDFYFELPTELIAQYPLANRSDSRLLTYCRKSKKISHQGFKSLTNFLEPGDLLVFNNSRVIPARLYGNKHSGGKIEILIERILDKNHFVAHIKASKSPKPDTTILLNSNWSVKVLGRNDDLFHCQVENDGDVDVMIHEIGHIPLPPYISRADDATDLNRYQTIYAEHKGSVAAPTAGLHFDDGMFSLLQEKGVEHTCVTLHVGAGTFRPVRSELLSEHQMHTEFYQIDADASEAIMRTKANRKKVIAVGTTAMRTLESAVEGGVLRPKSGQTNIFITPGYEFKICDGLLTNFHLPESTLLMLVSAFIGYKEAMELYQTAINEKYRFFSYGDASLLL